MREGQEGKTGVLFFSGGWMVGGVERVTVVLANEFVQRGRKVVVAFFALQNDKLLKDLDPRVVVLHLPEHHRWGRACRRMLREAVRENDVGYFLNAFRMTLFLRFALRGLGVKMIRYHHNKPDTNGRIANSSGVKRRLWKVVSALSVRWNYCFSHAYVLLSRAFIPCFRRFTHLKDVSRVYAVGNPLTMEVPGSCKKKENVILYVGRMDENQKKVSRIVEVWRLLYSQLSDWRLELVGDGPDRVRYEQLAADIPRIVFVGVARPASYYARAKMLLLTSDFEGWGLVLVEAMIARCVPVVLGSFESVTDVVANQDSGVVVGMPFDAKAFAEQVLSLATNEDRLTLMADEARRSAQQFKPSQVVDRWEKIFAEL